MASQRARKPPTSQRAGGHGLEEDVARARVWALVLRVGVVACASPATTARDTPVTGGEPPPRFAPGGPDAEALGANMGYPKGTPANYWRARWRVGSNSHLDEIFRGRLIHKASTPSRLMRVAEPRITYRGLDLTVDDHLSRYPTTGLLIARGDTIFVERYQYGRTDRHRLTSWSMAKTVTAMLIGIAIHEGRMLIFPDCRKVSHRFPQWASEAKLPGKVTFHTLRHTFASRLVMAGVDLLTVRDLGGWNRLEMVERYSHLAPAHKRAAVERLALADPLRSASGTYTGTGPSTVGERREDVAV